MPSLFRWRYLLMLLGPLALTGLLIWAFSSVQPAPTIAEAATPLPTLTLDLPTVTATLTMTLDLPTAAVAEVLTPTLDLPTVTVLTPTVALPTAALPEPQLTPPLSDDLGDRFCLDPNSSLSIRCQTPLVVKLLDYLYRNPEAPDRAALIERIHTLWSDPYGSIYSVALSDASAIIDIWVEETLVRPLQSTGLTADLQAGWEAQNGTIDGTDLDNDGEIDYVVTTRWMASRSIGEIYWLHNQAAGWKLERIPALDRQWVQYLPPEIVQIADFDADGQVDLAFSRVNMGGNTYFHTLSIVSRAGAGWRSLYAHDAEPTGGWEMLHDADGPLLIAHHHGGATTGTETLIRYDVQYRLRDGEFQPSRLVLHRDLTTLQRNQQSAYLLWSEQLLYAGQLDEAVAQLEELLRLPDPVDEPDYRPIALFRLGMARLLRGDVGAAQAAWAELERYPDSPIAQDMRPLAPLVDAPDDVWSLCAALAQRNPDWRVQDNDPYASLADWPSQCNSRLIVPFRRWTQDQSIAAQMQALDVAWSDLSTSIDLNGDGVPDPLGWLEWASHRDPWAFLSTADGYAPLLIAQPYPLGALDRTPFHTSWQGVITAVQLTDLDANGVPEVLLKFGWGFDLWVWTGDRFRSNWVQTGAITDLVPLQLAPQADGTMVLSYVAPAGQTIAFQLRDLTLERVPQQSQYTDLDAVMTMLFSQRDPAQALQMLDAWQAPPNADWPEGALWYGHEAQFLRGLALEYQGDQAAADQLFAALAAADPPSGWSVLAGER